MDFGFFDNLILVDMICHGVPSPLVWKKYLKERNQLDSKESKIKAINLRDKSTGWSNYNYSVRFEYQNGDIYLVQQNNDRFMQGFIANLYLRPSCSNCEFRGIDRCSDITLGDYWGVWNHYPEFDDNGGTSLVMIHSKKGLEIWKGILNDFRTLEISNEQAVQYNPSIIENSISSPKRTVFFNGIYQGKSVSEMVKRCVLNQKKITSIAKRVIDYLFNHN